MSTIDLRISGITTKRMKELFRKNQRDPINCAIYYSTKEQMLTNKNTGD